MREILMGQKEILGKVFSYYMLSEEPDGACGTYGVKISDSSGDSDAVPSLTCSREQCRGLVRRLIKCAVTEITLRDVVEDWLLRE